MRRPIFSLPLLCLLQLSACSGKPEQPVPAPATGADEAYLSPPRQAPAPEPEFVFPAERLQTVLAEMNALGAPYGAQVRMEDLQQAAAHRLKQFRGGFREYEYKEMRLPEPQVVAFTSEEKANPGPAAKWTEGGKVNYGDRLPRDGAAVTEAWTRVIGSRDLSTGDTIFIQTGIPKDKWRRQKWQPGSRRWSYFSEEEERAGMRNLLATRYSAANPDSKNSARFECERMLKAVEKARAAGRDTSGYYGTMRGALQRAFDKDLEREALKYLLDNK